MPTTRERSEAAGRGSPLFLLTVVTVPFVVHQIYANLYNSTGKDKKAGFVPGKLDALDPEKTPNINIPKQALARETRASAELATEYIPNLPTDENSSTNLKSGKANCLPTYCGDSAGRDECKDETQISNTTPTLTHVVQSVAPSADSSPDNPSTLMPPQPPQVQPQNSDAPPIPPRCSLSIVLPQKIDDTIVLLDHSISMGKGRCDGDILDGAEYMCGSYGQLPDYLGESIVSECFNPLFDETCDDAEVPDDAQEVFAYSTSDANSDFEISEDITPSPLGRFHSEGRGIINMTPEEVATHTKNIDILSLMFIDLISSISVEKISAAVQQASVQFAKTLIERAKASVGQVAAAVIYLKRVIKKNPTLRIPVGSGHRVLVVLLLLTEKIMEDYGHSNKTWSTFTTEFSNEDLNQAEVEMLNLVDYETHVSTKDFVDIYNELGICLPLT